MPTKLKKPITITLETVEDAVSIINSLDMPPADHPNYKAGRYMQHVDAYCVLREALLEINIDRATWQPLKAGGHEVQINPDGSIKAGCTTVDRATLERIYKASTDALANEREGEWPKFFKSSDSIYVIQSADKGHRIFFGSLKQGCFNWTLQEMEERQLEEITPTEASKILGREV